MGDALIGTLASLTCAATWAVASLIFATALSRTTASALSLSLVKSIIATPVLLAATFLFGYGLPSAAGHGGALIMTSVLGLVAADAAYLASIKRLGVQRGVLLIPLVPSSTALLAFVVLGESLGVLALLGVVLTLTGIVIAVRQPAAPARTASSGASSAASSAVGVTGVVLATIYVLTQAASNVLLKQVLDDAVAVHVAVLRLLVALPIMAVMALLWGGGAAGIMPLVRGQLGRLIVVAALVGTAFGIWLGSVGTQRLPVGIATTLAATTPVFTMLIARFRGDAVTARAVVGAVVAVCGVGLLALDRMTT
jgi:drug/metabolite transporter (DMT)-like permease